MAGDRPDVEIGARMKAKRLRFEEVPETEVRGATSRSERRNLPDEVEPGVTYEDVEVRWGAAARIEERRT